MNAFSRFFNNNIKTLSWLIISNVVNSLSHWALLVILVKYFTTTDVGFFTLGTAISAPIFMFSEMQMKSVLVVEPDDGKDYFKTYLFLRFIFTTLALFSLIVYCFLYKEANWIVISVIIYKAAESVIDILYGYLQKKDNMVWMSKAIIIKTLATLLVCFLATIMFYKILLSLVSLIIVTLIAYLVILFYIKFQMPGKIVAFSWHKGIDIVKKSFPLGISVLFGSYITNYPRITIEGICGPEQLAFFGAYSYFVIGVFQVSAPVTTFLRQRLSKCYQMSDYADFKKKVNLSITGFLIMGMLFIVSFHFLGDIIIKILYNESYVKYDGVIYFLIIAQMVMTISSIFSTAILSFNIYTKQAFVSFAVFGVVLLLSGFTIDKYGIYGGGYISLIAAIISMSVYCWLYMSKMKKWKREQRLLSC